MSQALPYNQDAEASVLGGILLRNDVLSQLDTLEVEDFYDHKHKVVFQAVRSLEAADRPIDIVTLEDEIEKAGKLEAIGGVAFLGELTLRVPTADNVLAYAEIIRAHHLTRKTRVMLAEVVAEAEADGRGGLDLVRDVAAAMNSLEVAATAGDGAPADEFRSMGDWLDGELKERREQGAKRLKFYVPFYDDYLRGVLPHDLVLIGAPSGVGKTDLSLSVATTNAGLGKRVHFFALEAERRELERRTKFSILNNFVRKSDHPDRSKFNFTDWLMGDAENICGDFNAAADSMIRDKLSGLYTFYRTRDFGSNELRRSIQRIYRDTDLIVIDHLHYLDTNDDNEARALGATVKVIRGISLGLGVPILLVAHLRKRDQRSKQLVISLDDFHGSSNVTKIGTQVLAIERANIPADKWYLSPTFMTIPKDRRSGSPNLIALTQFDRRHRCYVPTYTLGRMGSSGEWEEIPADDVPSWARWHRPISPPQSVQDATVAEPTRQAVDFTRRITKAPDPVQPPLSTDEEWSSRFGNDPGWDGGHK